MVVQEGSVLCECEGFTERAAVSCLCSSKFIGSLQWNTVFVLASVLYLCMYRHFLCLLMES